MCLVKQLLIAKVMRVHPVWLNPGLEPFEDLSFQIYEWKSFSVEEM